MRLIPVMGAVKEENLVLPNVGGTVMGKPALSHTNLDRFALLPSFCS